MAFQNFDAALQAYRDVPELKAHVLAAERTKVLDILGHGEGKPVPESDIPLAVSLLQARMTDLVNSPEEFTAAVNRADAIEEAAVGARLAAFTKERNAPAAAQTEEPQTVFTLDRSQDTPGLMGRMFAKVANNSMGRTAVLGAAGLGILVSGANPAMAQDKAKKGKQQVEEPVTAVAGGTITQADLADTQTIMKLVKQAETEYLKNYENFIDKSRKAMNKDDNLWREIVRQGGNIFNSGGGYGVNTTYNETREQIQRRYPDLLPAFDQVKASYDYKLSLIARLDPAAKKAAQIESDRAQAELEAVRIANEKGKQVNGTLAVLNDQLKKALEANDTAKAEKIMAMIEKASGAAERVAEDQQRNQPVRQPEGRVLTGAEANACFADYNSKVTPRLTDHTKASNLRAVNASLTELGADCATTIKKYLVERGDNDGNRYTQTDFRGPTSNGRGGNQR